MKTYEFDVRVYSRYIRGWFEDGDRRKYSIFSESDDQDRLERLGHGCYLECADRFFLPAEKLIILGLRHAGLLYYPGVRGYRVKDWNKYHCVITVDAMAISNAPDPRESIDISHYTPYWVNGYSNQEMGIMERIQKFFGPTADVINDDRMSMTGCSSD